MNDDIRISFDEAVANFRDFLRSNGCSDTLLWLTREHITGYRRQFWILRPEELISDSASRQFYETICQSSNSIRIDSFTQIDGKSLCYVENYGGNSRMLNFGILQSPIDVRVVWSKLRWKLLVIINRIRGESSFLSYRKITEYPYEM